MKKEGARGKERGSKAAAEFFFGVCVWGGGGRGGGLGHTPAREGGARTVLLGLAQMVAVES